MAAKTKLQFDLEWRTCLAVVLLLPLLVALGSWQLQRADEKRELQRVFEARAVAAPTALSVLWQADADALAYLPVELRGRFLPGHDVLLDNQMHRRRYGFHLLSVMALDAGGMALVNRGWIAGDPSRRTLPDVVELSGEQQLQATVYVPPGEAYVLKADSLETGWPEVIQAVDLEALGRLLPEDLFPYTLRVAPGQAVAEVAEWPVVNVSPEKHTGYAVQWFAMAGALLIVFVFASSNLRQVLLGRRKQ